MRSDGAVCTVYPEKGADAVLDSLAALTDDAKLAAKLVIVQCVFGGWEDVAEFEQKTPASLNYYMASPDECDCDWRTASDEWRIVCRSDGRLRFCELYCWPGDNEQGGGVLWHADRPAEKLIVFENLDGALTAHAYPSVVEALEKSRDNQAGG